MLRARMKTKKNVRVKQQIVGQTYLAVLVARLVGQHIVDVNESQSSKEK